MIESFYSMFKDDERFGSIGSWEECEISISGGAENPPFQRSIIQRMIQMFDKGVSRDHPYFRVALLPGGPNVEASISTKHGETVLRIPGGCLLYAAKESLLMAPVCNRPRPHWKLNLRVVVWVNKLYHLQHPIPPDV